MMIRLLHHISIVSKSSSQGETSSLLSLPSGSTDNMKNDTCCFCTRETTIRFMRKSRARCCGNNNLTSKTMNFFVTMIFSMISYRTTMAFLLSNRKQVNNVFGCNRQMQYEKMTFRMVDYKKPNVEDTENYRFYNQLSEKFRTIYYIDHQNKARTSDDNDDETKSISNNNKRKKVIIIGGGLSGLACGKYVTDAGHEAIIYEARNVLGGKVSAWQDDDGDWIETGLHIFFGAYPNMMNLLKELSIEDRLQWKKHQMIFAMRELPGEYTSFEFIPGIPAPFHFALAILMNTKMLSIIEKIQMVPALLPMLLRGQDYINEQDDYTVLQYMRKYGMPDRINDEIFISMAKALDFIDPNKLSMTVILTAMNRFINEMNGSQCAFLDGNPPERLCLPIQQYIERNGGKVYTNLPIQEIVTNDDDGSIKYLLLRNGERVIGDEYVSAMPVDIMKRMIPKKWQNIPYFRQLDGLEGIPVINLHMWFDRKFSKSVDHLCFSRSPLLSVYADMSVTCKEYYNPNESMLELVFAPCSPVAGSNVNWMTKTDEEIIDATMGELIRLFPTEIAPDDKWPSTMISVSTIQSPKQNGNLEQRNYAKLRKYVVVRTPRSVYSAIPGRNKYRPIQQTPIPNFTLAGDYTSQKYLGSMEGAILGGKLAAAVIARRASMTLPNQEDDDQQQQKVIPEHIIESAKLYIPHDPLGVIGSNAISFGGGASEPWNTK